HVVLQASMPHVRAGRRLQEIFASLGYAPDRMRLLLNRYTKHGQRARAALEEVLGMQPYQVFPDEPEIVSDAMNEGVPVSAISRSSGVARGLQKLAENLVCRPSASGQGRASDAPRLSRFFGLQRSPKLKTM
ncbi:MAG TPA: pilus assembly protein, partial [Trinickia sp.]|nr:pilus assembly protein [Trinickia sp.]